MLKTSENISLFHPKLAVIASCGLILNARSEFVVVCYFLISRSDIGGFPNGQLFLYLIKYISLQNPDRYERKRWDLHTFQQTQILEALCGLCSIEHLLLVLSCLLRTGVPQMRSDCKTE